MGYGFYDITLYYHSDDQEIDLEFTKRQNKISGRYVQLMNKYKPAKTTRISVELKDEDNLLFYFGSILNVEAAFDEESYWSLNAIGQDLMILNTIHRIALVCAVTYSWNIKVFETAYSFLLNELTSQ